MSAPPVILIYSRTSASLRDWLQQHGCPGTLLCASTAEEAAGAMEQVEAILAWRFPAELFAHAPRLRWVQSLGAGVDDVVTAPLLARDVAITRIVDQFGGYIAEYVFSELLARVRGLDRVRAAQREHHWNHFIADTLAGKTLGVAGLGSVGREIVRKGRAFDMRVHGLSRTPESAYLVDRHFIADGPGDESAHWAEFVRELDMLALTLPRTPATEGVVSATVLAAMQPHAILINVGRGILVDEEALIEALQARKLGGAILDVFREEPLRPESPLWDLPGVTVSPHISGPSTSEGVGAFFLNNVYRFLEGKPLVGLVNREAGY